MRSAFGAARAAAAGPRAWQTIAVSLLALPAGRIRRRSLMNQGEHPATGWRKPLICGRRRRPPAPCVARRSPACLTPGRQRANKGAARGRRQRLPPPRREAAAAHKARSPAAMGLRSAPARPIVWAPLCSAGPPVPNRTGRNSGSRTGTTLLEGALGCGELPGLACRACSSGTRAHAGHTGPTLLLPYTDEARVFLHPHMALGGPFLSTFFSLQSDPVMLLGGGE